MKTSRTKSVFRLLKKQPILFAATFNLSDFTPLVEDGSRFLQSAYNATSLGDYIQSLFDLAIVFGGIIAVLRIAYGGFLYMTSDIGQKKSEAKGIITNALIGLLLLLAIVIILQQINPDILNLQIRNLE